MTEESSAMKSEGVENKIDLSPDKQIYRSAAVDVSPVDAVEELVDNALDNWMRMSQRVDNIRIDIEAEDGYTRVTDNTGGLSRDRIKYLFALGRTFQHEVDGAIGAYGIGAKKAIVRLGDERTVKSRARGADTGYGFTVDEEWLDSDDWSVSMEEFDEIDDGVTELVMETDERLWDDDTLEQLQTELGKTYKLFLEGAIPDAGHVDLNINGSKIEPAGDPEWAFTPFDGLHTRRYENIELFPKDIETPVRMDVTVGLMREGDESISGTTIYCQDRLVTENEHGEVGGYGKSGRNRIGSGDWSHHNNKLMVIVELTTTGDGSELPWDSQKSTIDPHHSVSRAMYHWLDRIVSPYFDADSNKVKKAFVHPYDASHEHAANGGEIEVLDYSGKQNVTDKPDEDLTEIQRVMRLAEGYADRGFKYYDDIEEAFKPAFDSHFENYYDPKEHGGTPVDEVPVREDIDESERIDLEDQEAQLTSLVNSVSGAGKSKKESLMQAGYISLEEIADASINELASVSGVGRRLARRLQETAKERIGESTGEELDGEYTNTPDRESDGLETGESEAPESSDGATETSGTETTDTGAGATSEEKDASDDTDQWSSHGKSGEQDEDGIRVVLNLDREEYETLQNALNVEDEDVDAFAAAVRDQLLTIYPPKAH